MNTATRRPTPLSTLACLLLAACGTGSGDSGEVETSVGSATGGSAGSGGSAGAPSQNVETERECSLPGTAGAARFTLSGTACGEDLSFTGGVAQPLRLSRAALTDPVSRVTSLTLQDDPSDAQPSLPDYFDSFDVLLNLALGTGPELAVGSGPYALDSGVLMACDLGSLALAPGDVTISIEELSGPAGEGQIRLRLSNLNVAGFSPELGRLDVPACSGNVELTLEGAYTHDPG